MTEDSVINPLLSATRRDVDEEREHDVRGKFNDEMEKAILVPAWKRNVIIHANITCMSSSVSNHQVIQDYHHETIKIELLYIRTVVAICRPMKCVKLSEPCIK